MTRTKRGRVDFDRVHMHVIITVMVMNDVCVCVCVIKIFVSAYIGIHHFASCYFIN